MWGCRRRTAARGVLLSLPGTLAALLSNCGMLSSSEGRREDTLSATRAGGAACRALQCCTVLRHLLRLVPCRAVLCYAMNLRQRVSVWVL